MIDFTHLEGRDFEIVVKDLAAVDSHSDMVSYVFKRPYGLEEVSSFNTRMNHGCNWNGVDVLYSKLEIATS